MNDTGTPSRASRATLALLSALGIALVATIAFLPRSHQHPRRSSLRRHRSLDRFRRAILNNTKQNVAAALGPPQAAIMIESGPHGPTSTAAQHWWHADTWYYPLSRRQRSALAIRFDNQQARDVQIIHTPRITR